MSKLTTLLTAVALTGFICLGVQNITTNKNRLQLREIQLKSTSAELKLNELKYDQLNKQLDTERQQKGQNQDRINQLEKEKQDLENKTKELEQQVSAKQEAQRVAAARLNQAVALSTTSKVYAASGGCTDAKSCIYWNESHNDPGAINPSSGACGIGQALPCSKMPCSLSDYVCQDDFFTTYMVNRYHTWAAAWAYWQKNRNW